MKGPLIEFEGETPDEVKNNLVSAKEIFTEQRRRYAVKTSRGFVVLKKISMFDRDSLTIELTRDAQYMALLEEYKPLGEKMRAGVDLEAHEMSRLIELGEKMATKSKGFMIAAIAEPDWIKTLDDLDAFLSSLPDVEANALYAALTELSKPNPDRRLSSSVVALMKRFSIPLPPDLTIENMTAEQADLLMGDLQDEAAIVNSMREKIKNANPQV